MSIAKLFLSCSAVYWVSGVDGLGVPTQMPTITTSASFSTVTFYQATQGVSAPGEIVVNSILDIGTNSADTETTLSVGGYISAPGATAVFTDVTVTSMGTTAVVTGTYIQPAVVNYYNFTIVESSGGYWESAVKLISVTNSVASYGEYESCSFNGDGGSSVSCTDIIRTVTRSGVETFTKTFKGSTVPLTVMTVTAVPSRTSSGSVVTPTSSSNASTPTSSSNAVTPTSSSNAAMSSQQGSCWKMGLYVSMLSLMTVILLK